MFKLICVTNRKLCKGNYLSRIEKIAASKPFAIILREKDLNPKDYETLAVKVMNICEKFGVTLILHNFWQTAIKLKAQALHLPLAKLRKLSAEEKGKFKILGASCHSLGEAIEAENLGCTYITAGHIFDTDCKKGLPGKGLDFLMQVCGGVSIPVYAIGGVTPENAEKTKKAGVKGICVMSGFMESDDIFKYMAKWKNKNIG